VGLQLLDLRLRGLEGGAFVQLEVDQEFRTRGRRKELLLDQAEAGHRRDEQEHGGEDDQSAVAQTGLQQAPVPLVERTLVGIGVVSPVLRLRGEVGQQAVAQVRDEDHRHDP
jgi:hypothetical protein